MTVHRALRSVSQWEELNFLLTNRIPRRLSTRVMGWFSRIEFAPVRAASIWTWRLFCDVDLRDAKKQHFSSLHDCFVRELVDEARPATQDPDVLASPCDAIVGACGPVEQGRIYQVKDLPYQLHELLGDEAAAQSYAGGTYATLRLTAGMYHHFHAPHDLAVESVRYIHGDTWNVNPIALRRVEGLFCRNERAAMHARLAETGERLALVAVAAILVAGIRLPFLNENLRGGGNRLIPADARFGKGQKIGWFEHGSTIIVLAQRGLGLSPGIARGVRIRAGQPLFERPPDARSVGSKL